MRIAGALLLVLLASCGREPGLREKVLRDLAYRTILPGYRAFAEEAERLAREAEALDADPARIDGVRRAWKAAREAWSRCAAHVIGPEQDRLLHAKIDTASVSTGKIDEILSKGGPVDAAAVERLGADVKGFFAIEYLAFREAGPRERTLLVGLARNLAAVAAEIRDGWEDGKGGYAGRFASMPAQAALDLLMNHLVVFGEQLADGLARPAGLTALDAGNLRPELLPCRRSGAALEDFLAGLDGLRRIYEGGLWEPVAAVNPELDRAVRESLANARRDLAAIPRPLEAALSAHPEALRTAVVSLRTLRNRLAVDLVAVYRTTLTVSPFDGD